MARSSQYWVAVLIVLMGAAVAASMVGAEEAAPTMAERVEATKGMGMEQAAKLKAGMKTWTDWAAMQADKWTGKGKDTAEDTSGSVKKYATKGAETLKESTIETNQAATGMFSKWNTWAKEAASKFIPAGKPGVNPVSEAVAQIDKHTPGSLLSSEDEL